MKVRNRVLVVTGAGGGIGGAVVKILLERGAKVAAVDLRSDALDELRASLGAGDSLSLHTLNITERSDVEKLPESVMAAHGQVDGLVNCAGIVQPFVKINDISYEAVEHVMNVNFYGTLYMTKTFLPELLKRPEAHLANVSSMGGFLPVPSQSIYGASKAAVKLLTEGLFAELLDTNVKVSVVFPGATATDITKNSGVSAPTLDDAPNIPMLSSNEAARQIVDGIEKNQAQIFTGKDSKTMNLLYRLSPTRATKLIARQMKALLK